MRKHGVRSLIVPCLNDACRHTALIEVWSYPAETKVALQAPRSLCQVRRSGK